MAMQGFRNVMRRVIDPAKRLRDLWAGVCWFHTALLVGYGLTFLLFGVSAVPSASSYAVFVRYVPGHLATYGSVMLGVALLLLYGLLAPLYDQPVKVEWLRRVVLFLLGYDVLIAWFFLWSWLLTGAHTALSVYTWLAFAGLCAVLIWRSPDDRPGRGT